MCVHVYFVNVCISLLSASTFTTVLGGGNGQMTPVLGGQSTLEKDLLPSVLGGGCCERVRKGTCWLQRELSVTTSSY